MPFSQLLSSLSMVFIGTQWRRFHSHWIWNLYFCCRLWCEFCCPQTSHWVNCGVLCGSCSERKNPFHKALRWKVSLVKCVPVLNSGNRSSPRLQCLCTSFKDFSLWLPRTALCCHRECLASSTFISLYLASSFSSAFSPCPLAHIWSCTHQLVEDDKDQEWYQDLSTHACCIGGREALINLYFKFLAEAFATAVAPATASSFDWREVP